VPVRLYQRPCARSSGSPASTTDALPADVGDGLRELVQRLAHEHWPRRSTSTATAHGAARRPDSVTEGRPRDAAGSSPREDATEGPRAAPAIRRRHEPHRARSPGRAQSGAAAAAPAALTTGTGFSCRQPRVHGRRPGRRELSEETGSPPLEKHDDELPRTATVIERGDCRCVAGGHARSPVRPNVSARGVWRVEQRAVPDDDVGVPERAHHRPPRVRRSAARAEPTKARARRSRGSRASSRGGQRGDTAQHEKTRPRGGAARRRDRGLGCGTPASSTRQHAVNGLKTGPRARRTQPPPSPTTSRLSGIERRANTGSTRPAPPPRRVPG